jgi:hypothetical protein
MARLQVLINGEWEYVFCHNSMRRQEYPVITKDKRKSLKIDDMEYFQNKYFDCMFRSEPKKVKV